MSGASAITSGPGLFTEPLILLIAAVIAVPIFKRLGLGSVLGYLAAGVAIGPVAQIITDSSAIFDVSELGVVFFLFIVGLELKPARLWAMRADIFGLGLAQVALTGTVLTAVFWAVGWAIQPAIIIGFGLAMSSTAFAMQILQDNNEIATPYGEKSVAILLAQDLAVVPLLAIVPILSPMTGTSLASASGVALLKGVAALAIFVLAGRYLLNPLFRLIALARAREIMTAAALLVVIGAAMLMEEVGLSMAMGAFLAGVMLADSSFRHELEANIEPFRGILLGLFFIAVGMSINIDVLAHSWWRILLAVPAVMVIKAALLYGLNRLFGASHNDAVRTSMLLPQGGEFAFVLFASATAARTLWPSETPLVAGIVTVTMALTPLSVWLGRFLIRGEAEDTIEEDFEGAGGSVLVIGFGRFGQIVSQILLARSLDATIIDANPERIRQAARFGFRIYFGDGTRLDMLRAAGAEQASIICICVDQPAITNQIADLVLDEFPAAKVYVRSWDRAHTLELVGRGVHYEIRETYESALAFGADTLKGLGFAPADVQATLADVRRRDAERLALQAAGDLTSGREIWKPVVVQPEPLMPPKPPGARHRPAGTVTPPADGSPVPASPSAEPAAEKPERQLEPNP
ncbi:Kef-type potassium/proton antiporter, CPA2 family [Faunimonas pinastri]|uniref:Kef-type potassium/proton antiporter, CPA2 family n=1 Tax=Faunimonas pinastri TaxID=1855383 RepID=A0A1H8ZMM0_9HYPH|nr:monovalent cation:proton antiporter-2 (CPA2) family protein [Faunimonas pinastri]SEP65547.1 Kef-type potassium/proton antiporter, CPA2 family [Faunimonas pinastri]